MKTELKELFKSIRCTLDRRDWIQMENATNEEQELLDELFILSVRRLVDTGHTVLMECDRYDEKYEEANETLSPKKRKTKKQSMK